MGTGGGRCGPRPCGPGSPLLRIPTNRPCSAPARAEEAQAARHGAEGDARGQAEAEAGDGTGTGRRRPPPGRAGRAALGRPAGPAGRGQVGAGRSSPQPQGEGAARFRLRREEARVPPPRGASGQAGGVRGLGRGGRGPTGLRSRGTYRRGPPPGRAQQPLPSLPSPRAPRREARPPARQLPASPQNGRLRQREPRRRLVAAHTGSLRVPDASFLFPGTASGRRAPPCCTAPAGRAAEVGARRLSVPARPAGCRARRRRRRGRRALPRRSLRAPGRTRGAPVGLCRRSRAENRVWGERG